MYDMMFCEVGYGGDSWETRDTKQMDTVLLSAKSTSTALVPYDKKTALVQQDLNLTMTSQPTPIFGKIKVDVQDKNRPVFSISWDAASFALKAGLYYQIEALVQFMRDDASTHFGDVKGWSMRIEASALVEAATSQLLNVPAVQNPSATSLVLALSGKAKKAVAGKSIYLRISTSWDNTGTVSSSIEIAITLIMRSVKAVELIPLPGFYQGLDYSQIGASLEADLALESVSSG